MDKVSRIRHVEEMISVTRFRKMSLAFAAAGTMALTGLVAPAASAGAGDCLIGYACVYEHRDFDGRSYGTAYGGGMPDRINNMASSASANGAQCKNSDYYDGSGVIQSTTYFRLNSRSLVKANYFDPYLTNGAGKGPGAGQNWNDRVSSVFFTGC